jgi:hypothetical protein
VINDGLLDNINESQIYFLCLKKLWPTQVTPISKVQCLKVQAQWKKKGKEELHSFCQNTKRDRGESFIERYYRNGSSLWFRKIKMKRHVFVAMNRMRAGYSSLKASLRRFNIVSMAECECGDGLQMEEHIFWDCKLYKDQRAAMMDILSENNKKVSYRALKARGKKICTRRLLLHKQYS